MDIQKFFNLASNDIKCNTSYPLKPEYFSQYRKMSNFDIFESNIPVASLYFHIPFCKTLCKFCEYTKFKSGNLDDEWWYAGMLDKQSSKWLNRHSIGKLAGLDVGGGTPTSVSDRAFQYIMHHIKCITDTIPKTDNYEPSIEFSYPTITSQKLDMIAKAGFTRVSAGLQLVDETFLAGMNRQNSSISRIITTNKAIHAVGIKKINLDIMYGFPGQTPNTFKSTLNALATIRPEHITLYEMRYNMTDMSHAGVTPDTNSALYDSLYSELTKLGYNGEYGRNTFTLLDDEGVSSYLLSRMRTATQYRGFGISAQSMSKTGIAYNTGKGMVGNKMPDINMINDEYVYDLPPAEMIAKYVAIALYSGKFYLDVLDRFMPGSARVKYSQVLDFLSTNGYINIIGNEVRLTRNGFAKYGAIASLFWSDEHKAKWFETKKKV